MADKVVLGVDQSELLEANGGKRLLAKSGETEGQRRKLRELAREV